MCHFHSQHLGQLFLPKIHLLINYNSKNPYSLVPNQFPPPTFALGLLPTTPHLQNQISPRVLWPHSLNRAFYNLPPYEENPYQNISGHTFVPQNTTQTKTFQIPSTQMSQTTNAMTQTTEPVQQSTRPT